MTLDARALEDGVLAVLAGASLEEAAAQVPMDPADLAEAVETFRAAGQSALNALTHTREWHQVRIHFTDWDKAEETAATSLGPTLQRAHGTGGLSGWWFLRKHPCWRLRCRPGPNATTADVKATLAAVLDRLVKEGTLQRWWETHYEPEILAFGGNRGMAIAHDLFHADSSGILSHLNHSPASLAQSAVGRRELSVLLCASLYRGARQDSHEQGDIWHRVVQMRPVSKPPPTDRLHAMAPGLQRLMNVDASPTSTLFEPAGPLPYAAPWATAFTNAGRHLADAARDGTLERGIRDILANHVIFHWNRIGMPASAQAVLARAARETLMNTTTAHKPGS